MKSRLQGAQKGHGLLKKKADALQMRFRMILGKIIEVLLILYNLMFTNNIIDIICYSECLFFLFYRLKPSWVR